MNRVRERFQGTNKIYPITMIILLVIYLIKMRMGLDQDELYMISLGRHAWSDAGRYSNLYHLWQMCGWFAAPFLGLFYGVTGSWTGVVLYMRWIYLFFQMLVAILTYLELRHFWGNRAAELASVMSFVFYYYFWMVGYKSQLFWFLMLTILSVLHYCRTEKMIYVILSGIFFSIAVLSYITCILVAVPVFWFLFKKKRSAGICFLITGAVCAALSIAFMLHSDTWQDILLTVRTGFSSPGDTTARGGGHKEKLILATLALGVGSALPLWLIRKIRPTVNLYMAAALYYALMLAVICILRPHSITISRFWYVLFSASFSSPILMREMDYKHRDKIRFFYMVSIWLLLTICLSTLQGVAVVAFGGIFGLLSLAVVLVCAGDEGGDRGQRTKKWRWIYAGELAAMLIFCFVFFVSDEEGVGNIFDPRAKMETGIAKGLYVEPELKAGYLAVEKRLAEEVSSGDVVIAYCGNYTRYIYTSVEAESGAYEYFMDWYSHFRDYDQLRTFYERFPEKIPDVIFIDPVKNKDWDQTDLGKWFLRDYEVHENDGWLVLDKKA